MPPLPTPEEIAAALRMPGSRPIRAGSEAYASDEEQIAGDDTPFAQMDTLRTADKANNRLRMLTEATNASAYIHARLLGIRPRYQSDPDFATITQRYEDETDRIVGLDAIMPEAVTLKFIAKPVTAEQLSEMVQIPPRS